MLNQRIYNSRLNPDIWDESGRIRPDVLTHLVKIGRDFYDDVELKATLQDIILIGSSANYNWTPESDIDIHLVIDVKELGMDDKDSIINYLDALKQKWNSDHDITIKGHKVETYIQDVDHKTHATGIFSL